MKNCSLLICFIFIFWFVPLSASTVKEEFKIEGLISPASPKALQSELEKELKVKVLGLELTNTESGWPVLTLQYDSSSISKEEIEKTIAKIEDPAGHNYKVHHGPLQANAALTKKKCSLSQCLVQLLRHFPN